MGRIAFVACASIACMLLAVSAFAVQVGWSVDVHQNQFHPCADDFHVWGVLESISDQNGSHPPTLISRDDLDPYNHYQGTNCYSGVFDQFSYQIGGIPNINLPKPSGYIGPWPPTEPYYYFEANWWSDTNCVEYCNWAHFGLKFDENDGNYGYWLQGIWTAEHGAQYAQDTIPIVGFSVIDGNDPYIRIQNATDKTLGLSQMDVMVLPTGTNFAIENLSTNFFDANPQFVWKPVSGAVLPMFIAPDSFFDVFLESVPAVGNFGGGQVLLSRQLLTYQTTGGVTESFWEYQLHESIPEPASIISLLAGLSTLGILRRRLK